MPFSILARLGPNWIALAILLLAWSVRLLAMLPGTDVPLGSVDESEYLALGQNIRLHGTFSYGRPHVWGELGVLDAPGPYEPTAGRAPFYPLVIAALWWGEAPPVLSIRVVQVVLGGLVAMFVYLIALRAFGPRAALVAGIGMALSPLNALYASLLFPQVLFTFLLSVGVWFCGRQQGFWAGLFLGAAALTRSVLLPLILLAGLAGLLFRFRRATHLMLVLGALLMIAPWTVRNVVTQQTFIAIASMGWGANIFFGTFDPPYGGEKHIWELIDDEGTAKRIIATSSTLTEIEGRMFVEGLRRIADNPVGWLWTRVHQYPRLFLGTPSYLFPDAPIPRSIINAVYFTGGALFVALSALGLFMARGRWRCVYHIAAFPIFFAVAQFPALTDERFGLDMMPMMMVFAGFAVSELWRRLTMMRRKH